MDVKIEFSTPDTAFDNIGYVLAMFVVVETTGWLEKLKVSNETGAGLFYASNFSG